MLRGRSGETTHPDRTRSGRFEDDNRMSVRSLPALNASRQIRLVYLDFRRAWERRSISESPLSERRIFRSAKCQRTRRESAVAINRSRLPYHPITNSGYGGQLQTTATVSHSFQNKPKDQQQKVHQLACSVLK